MSLGETGDALMLSSAQFEAVATGHAGVETDYNSTVTGLEQASAALGSAFDQTVIMRTLVMQIQDRFADAQESIGVAQSGVAMAVESSKEALRKLDDLALGLRVPVTTTLQTTEGGRTVAVQELRSNVGAIEANTEVEEAVPAVLASEAAEDAINPESERFARIHDMLKNLLHELLLVAPETNGYKAVVDNAKAIVLTAKDSNSTSAVQIHQLAEQTEQVARGV